MIPLAIFIGPNLTWTSRPILFAIRKTIRLSIVENLLFFWDDVAGVLEDAVLGHEAADAACGIDGAVSAHDGSGVAHGVAAELGPVADHGPYFLDAGLDDLVAVVHHYQVAVALDV